MIRTLSATFFLIFICSAANAKDIRLFNPDVLGQVTLKEIKPLRDKISDEIEPISIMIDVKCGKYYAASVIYSEKVTFTEARQSLNKLYNRYENLALFKESKQALWRVKDKGFAIHLVQEENRIRIMYLQFQPAKEVFKGITRSTGADTGPNDSECGGD